ncbi:MAG: methyltransferase [Ferruginibacter sp.]
MANTYFHFKQFTIYQDKTPMKVCTDACILGAWAAHWLNNKNITPANILDIGTGTGLLALMMAQETAANVTAIEPGLAAYEQATENFIVSPFAERVTAIHTRLQDFITPNKFDVIIVNPPFYESDLVSPNPAINEVRHSVTLGFRELATGIGQHLSDKGFAFILIPYSRNVDLVVAMKTNGLYPVAILHIRQSTHHDFFRSITLFSRNKEKSSTKNELVIHSDKREYTEDFTRLLKPFYLKL